MAISKVQYKAQSGSGSVTSLTVTLDSPSTAGNLLVAVVAHATGSSNSLTISPPAGWSTAVGPVTMESPAVSRLYIFYRWNCPGSVSSYAFSSSGAAGMAAAMWEYSGVKNDADPLDKTASAANGTFPGVPIVTGTTAATTQADEVVLAVVGTHQGSAVSWSSVINSFTAETTAGSSGGSGNPQIQPLSKIVSSTGAQNSGATPSAANGAAGAIASFKAAPAGGTFTVDGSARVSLQTLANAKAAAAKLALVRQLAAEATLALNETSRTTMAGEQAIALKTAANPKAAAATIALTAPSFGNPIAAGARIALAPFVPPVPPGFTVFLEGQDITEFVEEESYRGTSVLGQGAGVGAGGTGQATTCEFDVWLGPVASAIGKNQTPSGTDLVRQGEVLVFDARGTKVFGGYATIMKDITESLDPQTHINCHDYWQHLDRIQVNNHFFNADDVTIIKSLLDQYAPFIDQSLIPAFGNQTYPDKILKDTLRGCIQKLADENGWMVWVDPEKRLHYASPSSGQTAPFGVSDDADSVLTQPHQLHEYVVDDTGIINRVVFYGGKSNSPDFTQDLSVQANGVNKTFFIAYQSHNASDGQKHLVQNGVELALGSVFDTSAAGLFKSQGGDSDALINSAARIITFDVAPLGTDTLTFEYRYQTPLVIIMSNAQSHNFYGDWYEGRITDSSVFDSNLALQRCRVLLAQQAFGLVSVSLTVWTPGIQAGQLLNVKNAVRGVDETFLVQKVVTKPTGGGTFEYDIELGAWNWNLVDLLVQNARVLNPADTNIEEDISVIQARESVTGATVVIAITTSTNPSGQYFSGEPNTLSGFFTVTG